VNLMVGSGMQQARRLEEEEPVKVVRNHEGGPRPAPGSAGPKHFGAGEDSTRSDDGEADLWTTPWKALDESRAESRERRLREQDVLATAGSGYLGTRCAALVWRHPAPDTHG